MLLLDSSSEACARSNAAWASAAAPRLTAATPANTDLRTVDRLSSSVRIALIFASRSWAARSRAPWNSATKCPSIGTRSRLRRRDRPHVYASRALPCRDRHILKSSSCITAQCVTRSALSSNPVSLSAWPLAQNEATRLIVAAILRNDGSTSIHARIAYGGRSPA